MRPSVLAAAILFTGALAAQQIPFIKITGPNAPAGATLLFEDHRGGLWLGGIEGFQGLRYFDGSRFTVPVPDDFRFPISGIAEDGEGGIWLGAWEQGLYRLFRGRMQKMFDGDGPVSVISIVPHVLLATLIPRGRMPRQTTVIRIARVNGIWTFEPLAASAAGARVQPDGIGRVLYPCEGGYCEIQTSDVVNWTKGGIVPVNHHLMRTSSPGLSAIRDHFGCAWIRSYTEAVYQCASDRHPVILPSTVAGNGGDVLSQFDDGSMVIPSFGRLAIGRPGNFRIITMANGYPSFGSLLVGKDGSVWLSNANGLFVLPSHPRMEYWTQRDGLDGNTWSILPLDGTAFAVSGDSIRRLDGDRSRWHLVREFRGATHLMAGPGHTVLASSRTQGVIQMDMEGKVLRQSPAANVMMLAQSADGQIWSTGSRVSRVQVSGLDLRLQSVDDPALKDPGMDLKIARDGTMWNCGSEGFSFGNAAHWHDLVPANGPGIHSCRTFTMDAEGEIWYGGDTGLIQRPRLAHPVVRDLGVNGDAGNGTSYFFGTDKSGRIWRGTANGVYVAEPEQARRREWLRLDQDDGLPGVDTNQRSFFADEDGSVWFGVDSSVVHLFPSNDLVRPAYAPRAFVSGFSWGSEPFRMAYDTVRVPYGANVTAQIGSLQMDRRHLLHFRYRVLPEQSAWTEGRKTDVPLGKIRWGSHRFEVQASLGAGPWSNIAQASVEILRPAWFSVPALLGFASAGTLLAGGLYRWRRKIRMRARTDLPDLAHWRLSALSADLQSFEGSVLDHRFEVQRIIARGGFATVWEARDRQQKMLRCAVKIFRRELLDNAWMTRRFQQEVSALQCIQHPNVVRIYGYGSAASSAPYLVMELIEGETLRERLDGARLKRFEIASYLRQISAALSEIHRHGIRHRDLKPENLMIRRNAKPGAELVLIDFSIAIVQDPDETVHGLSRAAGTLYYMAPEQAIGFASQASDIYSLAKIVIEMLAGERLSTLLPDASIDLPARVSELLIRMDTGLSQRSVDLIATALEFDPRRRPNHADDFSSNIAADLEINGSQDSSTHG